MLKFLVDKTFEAKFCGNFSHLHAYLDVKSGLLGWTDQLLTTSTSSKGKIFVQLKMTLAGSAFLTNSVEFSDASRKFKSCVHELWFLSFNEASKLTHFSYLCVILASWADSEWNILARKSRPTILEAWPRRPARREARATRVINYFLHKKFCLEDRRRQAFIWSHEHRRV